MLRETGAIHTAVIGRSRLLIGGLTLLSIVSGCSGLFGSESQDREAQARLDRVFAEIAWPAGTSLYRREKGGNTGELSDDPPFQDRWYRSTEVRPQLIYEIRNSFVEAGFQVGKVSTRCVFNARGKEGIAKGMDAFVNIQDRPHSARLECPMRSWQKAFIFVSIGL
jgi:hypothetical protein